MFVYTLLFAGLLGLLGTSANDRCRKFTGNEFNEMQDLILKKNKCPCEKTFRIDGDNQTACKCYEVPKDEGNCNLDCFVKAIKKLKPQGKKCVKGFIDRASICKAEKICFQPCGEKENVNASIFTERVKRVMQNINIELTEKQQNNNQ